MPARRAQGAPPLPVPAQGAPWTLAGGLRVAFERRAGAGFALDLRIPVGSAHDPRGHEGSGGVLEEWLSKGAGGRDARALQDAFDDLGLRRGGGVGPEATRISVGGLQADLPAALGLVADLLIRPALPEGELEVLRDLARQDLEALEDSPSDRLAVAARTVAFAPPLETPFAGYAHPASGTPHGLRALGVGTLRAHLERYGQAGAVLGLVADVEAQRAADLVASALGGLRRGCDDRVPAHFQPGKRAHVTDGAAEQTQLSLTAPGVAPTDPRWLAWQTALGALSGGSASRLFVAVREERGLAYSVGASGLVLDGQGLLSVYAATGPARAAETLEVLGAELARLSAGLTPDEFGRARRALEAGVVFGTESGRSRAHALTRDVALFGRVRPPAELRAALRSLTLEEVNAFLAEYDPLSAATVVTLGPGAGP